jgi:hypothetical protein
MKETITLTDFPQSLDFEEVRQEEDDQEITEEEGQSMALLIVQHLNHILALPNFEEIIPRQIMLQICMFLGAITGVTPIFTLATSSTTEEQHEVEGNDHTIVDEALRQIDLIINTNFNDLETIQTNQISQVVIANKQRLWDLMDQCDMTNWTDLVWIQAAQRFRDEMWVIHHSLLVLGYFDMLLDPQMAFTPTHDTLYVVAMFSRNKETLDNIMQMHVENDAVIEQISPIIAEDLLRMSFLADNTDITEIIASNFPEVTFNEETYQVVIQNSQHVDIEDFINLHDNTNRQRPDYHLITYLIHTILPDETKQSVLRKLLEADFPVQEEDLVTTRIINRDLHRILSRHLR